MKASPDNWIAFVTDSGWELFHPLTGRRIVRNGRGNAKWVEWHAKSFDPFNEAETEESTIEIMHVLTEQEAEQVIQRIALALGAIRITNDEGELL